jgi:hypothetical protein
MGIRIGTSGWSYPQDGGADPRRVLGHQAVDIDLGASRAQMWAGQAR